MKDTHFQTLNNQSEVPQNKGNRTNQKRRNRKETPNKRFVVYFHTFLYGALTATCVEELIRTGHVPEQLMIFWYAEAAYVGVPTFKEGILKVAGLFKKE